MLLFRQQLTRSGTLAKLFERFDRSADERGYLALGGQIVDATKARIRQISRDGRWTLKRGKKLPPPEGAQRHGAEIAVPGFSYKNHIGIDRTHGFVRRFVVTHDARGRLNWDGLLPERPPRRPEPQHSGNQRHFDFFDYGTRHPVKTPGHTPGHQILVVNLPNRGRVGITTDTCDQRDGCENLVPMPWDWSTSDMSMTRMRLKQLDRSSMTLFLCHDARDFRKLPQNGKFWD